jgi:hypothetical protein
MEGSEEGRKEEFLWPFFTRGYIKSGNKHGFYRFNFLLWADELTMDLL